VERVRPDSVPIRSSLPILCVTCYPCKRFALVHIGYDLSQEFSFLNETRGVGHDFMVYLDETNVLERNVNFLNCSEMNWNLFLLGERMKFFYSKPVGFIVYLNC
jgi:hypothetical protein